MNIIRGGIAVLSILHVLISVVCDEVILLYSSDMTKLEEQTPDGRSCVGAEKERCVGGFPRLIHTVHKYRETEKDNPIIFADLGNFAAMSLFFYQFKSEVIENFVKMLQADVMTIAPRDFYLRDDLARYLKSIGAPCVVTNLKIDPTNPLSFIIKRHHVIRKSGKKFGILGFIDIKDMFTTVEGLEVEDVFTALQRECDRLMLDGTNVIIAIGAAHFRVLKEILMEVPCIDVILTSNAFTFLYNGEARFKTPIGPYPITIANKQSTVGLLGGSCTDNRYVCHLKIETSAGGEIISWEGQPIELSEQVPRDAAAVEFLSNYRKTLEVMFNEENIIGASRTLLEGQACMLKECTLGNLFTDSMATYGVVNNITKSRIAVILGDVFYQSIDGQSLHYGKITKGDLIRTVQFEYDVNTVTMKGRDLIDMLEKSFSQVDDNMTHAFSFLQVSGIRVTYNTKKPAGQRVIAVSTVCTECSIPYYTQVEPSQNYSLAMGTYLANGGHKHSEIVGKILSKTPWNISTVQMVEWYLKKYTPVYPIVEGRITQGNLSSKGHPYRVFRSVSFTNLFALLNFVIIF